MTILVSETDNDLLKESYPFSLEFSVNPQQNSFDVFEVREVVLVGAKSGVRYDLKGATKGSGSVSLPFPEMLFDYESVKLSAKISITFSDGRKIKQSIEELELELDKGRDWYWQKDETDQGDG